MAEIGEGFGGNHWQWVCKILTGRLFPFRLISAHGRLQHLKNVTRILTRSLILLLVGGASPVPGRAQDAALDFVPARTTVKFTLGDTIHTVHGEFDLKRGGIHFNSATGVISGEIVVDATSGRTGNGMRDRKMHKDILESAANPEIVFRPDRIDGKVANQGKSNIQVHGIFSIHGGDHEIMIPVEVEMGADHWSAAGHFVVPYQKWGIKNPSTFILRVSESVELDVRASGANPWSGPGDAPVSAPK
jgi:polyisoprenoid-binding protein YceI